MNRPLHVVVLDHSRDGLAPLLAELQQRGYSTVCRTVTRLEELAAVLDERAWDLIVAHDGLAGNLAFRALDLLRVRGIDIPFILVGSASEARDESRVLQAVDAGADDCVDRDQPVRFVAASPK